MGSRASWQQADELARHDAGAAAGRSTFARGCARLMASMWIARDEKPHYRGSEGKMLWDPRRSDTTTPEMGRRALIERFKGEAYALADVHDGDICTVKQAHVWFGYARQMHKRMKRPRAEKEVVDAAAPSQTGAAPADERPAAKLMRTNAAASVATAASMDQ